MRLKLSLFLIVCASLFSVEHVYLKTPQVSRDHMMGTTTGIRPVRKTGIRLEGEWLHDKFLIHNYGYGGSGLTLAFGGAQEVLDILSQQQMTPKTVAVLGGGVVGLTTAYDLLERGYEVHLYAEAWSPHLTSNVAAGIWTPYVFPSERPELHQRLLEIAEKRFLKSTGNDPEFAGVRQMTYYVLHPSPTPEEEIVIHFDNGVVRQGRQRCRIGLDGKVFMDDLYSQVKAKGALVQQKRFETIEEILALEEEVIVNCMSMGSRELFNDREFIPVRGHMAYLHPQADIDYALVQHIDSNYFFCIYPWGDRIILGGVYEYGEEELVLNQEALDRIFEHAATCLTPESP